MKKIISLMLCLAMILTLSACGGTSIESYADGAEETAETVETVEAAEPAQTAESAGLGFDAYPADTVVGTINGKDVTWMEYFYWLNYYVMYVQQLAAAHGVTLTSWDANELSSTDSNATVVMLNTQYAVTQHHAVQDKAEELGIALDEADKALMLEVVEANADQGLGDADGVCTEEEIAAFEDYLAEQYVDRAFFDYLNEVSLLSEKLYLDAYGEFGVKYPDESVAAFVEENDYLSARHILLLTTDMTTGEALSEDEIAAKKALAEDLLGQLQAVEGTAQVELFDQLTAEYTEDTGYAAYPEGYIFGAGEMVAEFENAVRGLDVNYGLSGIVESSYGYHIILRTPVNPDGVIGSDSYGNEVTLRYQLSSNAFNADMETWQTEAEVVWNEGFESMDLTAIFG